MKTTSTLRITLGLVLGAVSASFSSAQIVNPGFETGTFAGWQLSAGARATVVKTATDYPIDPFTLDFDLTKPYTVGPVGGNYFARLEAGMTPLAATESFLWLSAGTLSTPITNPFGLADASAVAQTVWLQAGDTFRFNWNFLAVDVADVGDDFAFFSATNGMSSTFSLLAMVSDVGSGNGTGWQQVAFTAQTSGSYRMGFGVANFGDNTVNSTLYLDPLPVGAIPEPSTYGLLGALGCIGLIALRRKCRS